MVNNIVVCHLPSVLRATEVQEDAGSVSLCVTEYLPRVDRHRGPATGELDIPSISPCADIKDLNLL